MLHPTEQAVGYIWDKFQESLFDETTVAMSQAVSAIMDAASHRPMDPESNSYQRFLKKQLEIIDELEAKNPALDFAAERERFEGFRL